MNPSNKATSRAAYHILFPAVLFICTAISSLAQTESNIDTDLSIGKMKDRAKYAAKIGDIYTSLFYYEEIVRRDSQDTDAYFELAEMHRESRNYKKAEEAYSKVFSKEPAKYPIALFNKALMQKMSGKYEEAKKNFILFRKEAGNLGDRNLQVLLNKEIAGCDSGIVYREFPDNIRIENAGNSVNHPHAEFSPLLLDSNTLIFGSLRLDTLTYFDVRHDHYEKQPVRQVYKAVKKNGKWENIGKYEILNDPHMEMGNFIYSPYSNRYYFTKCLKNEIGHVACKIYMIENVNGQWSHATALPEVVNKEGFTSTQPTVVIDTATAPSTTAATPGNKQAQKPATRPGVRTPARRPTPKPAAAPGKTEYLYFVSNRPGGKGDLDIWYTSYNSARKEWTEPINFALINTSENECTPFFHVPTQTLYFSSNGHTNTGGLDVFKSTKEGRKYSKPQNLAFPINSPQDELGFSLSDDGKKGFFVSNRPGGTPYFHETCCDDIYSFEVLPVKPFICTLDLSVVNPDTTDCKGQLLKVMTYDLKTKKETLEKVTLTDCKYKLPLNKNYRYSFTIERPGFEKDTLVVETRDMASSDVIQKTLELKKIQKEKPVSLINETPTEGKAFVLKDIQYASDDASLNDESKKALDSILIPFLKEHAQDMVLISSHTDDQGSHKYNTGLSQRRAENVVKYLISKGIDAKRLQPKGYGETKPIAPNLNPDGSGNPFGRALNRRTEFLLTRPDGTHHNKH